MNEDGPITCIYAMGTVDLPSLSFEEKLCIPEMQGWLIYRVIRSLYLVFAAFDN